MLEYATPENATLFGYELAASQNNLDLYEGDEKPQWAEPYAADIATWMQTVYRQQSDETRQREIADRVRSEFSFGRMAECFMDAMGLAGGAFDAASVTPVFGAATGGPFPGISSARPLPAIDHDETLGVGIPTRDRPGYLLALLGALYAQSRRPQAICIVNDSDNPRLLEKEPAVKHMRERWERSGIRFEIVPGTRRGASPNHQLAMQRLGTELVLRMDDDLLPACPDFAERLYRIVNRQPEIGAAGGVYPFHTDGAVHSYAGENKRPGMTNRLDDLLQGKAALQFWQYGDEALVDCQHLYSSWLYRAEYLRQVGGFPDCYTRFGQREETDASVRLHLLGGYRLLVDTQAVAWHFLAGGGRRPEGSRERVTQDDKTFRQRLAEWRAAAR